MSNEVMFIQAGHDSKIVELPIPEKRTESALMAALVAAGLLNDENLRVFVEDSTEGER